MSNWADRAAEIRVLAGQRIRWFLLKVPKETGGGPMVVLIGALVSALATNPKLALSGAIAAGIGGLWANYSQNRDSRLLNRKNEEIARLSREIVNTVTGGPAHCYLVPYGGTGPHAMLCARGDYPLYGVAFRVTDLQIFEQVRPSGEFARATVAEITIGEMAPNSGQVIPQPIFQLHGERRSWNIHFSGRNGFYTQLLRMRRVNGKWEKAVRVLRPNGSDVAFEQISGGYPRQADGTVEWADPPP